MRLQRCSVVWAAITLAAWLVADGWAEAPSGSEIPAAAAKQQLLKLPVRVVDTAGKPVAKAKVAPWALRSSQGHGLWKKDDEGAGVGPRDAFTNDDGIAVVLYPQYRDVQEEVRTLSVSINVDHPDFAFVGAEQIDVPLESEEPHEVKLTPGVALEIRPRFADQPADLNDLFVLWSDGRSWKPEATPEKTPQGTLRIPGMRPGANSVLLVKLAGDRAAQFSKITDFEIKAGRPKTIEVPLYPSLRVSGVLSDNVPRPVRNGRLKTATLDPAGADNDRVSWFSWTSIQPDGTFTIEGWPADEPLQLIALCDGYIAASGTAPPAVLNPRDPKSDPFNRPQVFQPVQGERIEVAMTPLIQCLVTAVDEDGQPAAGVTVESWPNVGWWNGGSQIYCHPLVRCERMVHERAYLQAIEKALPAPFQGKTDAHGKLTLELPAGGEELAVTSDVYELPPYVGRREVPVRLVRGKPAAVSLRLQPRGSDKLGEWDKLAGVVFGCSTREGRRIRALPGVEQQMDEFLERLREAKNERDPQLLSEAYGVVADAFADAGDKEEAVKWRKKAAEQAAKAKSGKKAAAD